MKRSEIYREAARMIAQGENVGTSGYVWAGACDVLDCCESYSLHREDCRFDFRDTFLQHKGWLYIASDEMGDEGAQEWRILALCFMAAIANDEERCAARAGRSPKRATKK